MSYDFVGCTSLESIKLPPNVVNLNSQYSDTNGVFQNCSSLKELYIPESVVKIGAHLCLGCTNLEKVNMDLPNLESIGQYIFRNCTNAVIEDVNLPKLKSVYSRNYAFENTRVKKVSSLGEITDTYEYMFNGCKELESVTLPNTLTTIGAFTFNGCSAWTEDLILPPNVTTCAKGCFRGAGIRRVLDLAQVTTLVGTDNWNNFGVFDGCPNLEIVILSELVVEIGSWALKNCIVLEAVVCKNPTPPTLGSGAFTGSLIASGTGSIYVPDPDSTGKIVEAYKTATNWNIYASRIFPVSQLEIDNPELYAEIEEYL